MKIIIDQELCIGCGTCAGACSQCFEMDGGKAKVINTECKECNVQDIAGMCPVGAIKVEE